MIVEQELVNWYLKNKRDLPWRNTRQPYKLWIAEIILQQTRVEQGLDYYYRFLKTFPDVYSLANSTEDDILKSWQGLGYYSRARNLHFSAKYIVNELNGIFPQTFKKLKQLKGVGDYTAAAIASFAYNEKVPLVDGNVFRFLSRLYAEPTPIDTAKGKTLFFKLAEQLIQSQEPMVFNQAIMEFGALQCKPMKPNCNNCILKAKCIAFERNEVNKYPVKTKSLKTKKRFFNYLFIKDNGSVFLRKRTENDIWKGLFEFPLIETKAKTTLETLSKTRAWNELFRNQEITIHPVSDTVTHQLSHQQLFIEFYQIKSGNQIRSLNEVNNYISILVNDVEKYPVPKVIESYLKSRL